MTKKRNMLAVMNGNENLLNVLDVPCMRHFATEVDVWQVHEYGLANDEFFDCIVSPIMNLTEFQIRYGT